MEAQDRPGEPGDWERCVSRELAEETGLQIPPDAWRSAGQRITPPMFPLRFRTRFFVADLPASAGGRPLDPSSPERPRYY